MGQENEAEPESFRAALAVIKELRDENEHWEYSYRSACKESIGHCEKLERAAPLLAALRYADPQTLPEPIAKLVAAWKAGT